MKTWTVKLGFYKNEVCNLGTDERNSVKLDKAIIHFIIIILLNAAKKILSI